MNYDFRTLSDFEFEEFSLTLLSKALGVSIERFKPGTDQGVDGRFVDPEDGREAVIQCKHFQSGFPQLYRSLVTTRKCELRKVEILKPDRYIIITSMGLTPANKRKIFSAFHPYIQSEADIIGRETLNDMLRNFPEVESQFYKLWVSSTQVLQRVLHNRIYAKSDAKIREISESLNRYVQTDAFDRAYKRLKADRVLILEGEPGIGKTTLADVLSYRIAAEGFQFVFTDSEVNDLEDLYRVDCQQIFYFDDFLGHNYLEAIQNRLESKITNLIKRVRRSNDKYLILTSRTNILSSAKMKYDCFNNINIGLNELILTVKDYSLGEKAKILHNHMFFSALPLAYLKSIVEQQRYLEVIYHDNYNPRIIEHVLDNDRARAVGHKKFWQYFVSSLENPESIWLRSYERQIDDESRILLETVFSLGDSVPETIVEEAFQERLRFEVERFGHKPSTNPYNDSLKALLKMFLLRDIDNGKQATLKFFNPSVVDFLLSYFTTNRMRRGHILESAIFVEQYITRFSDLSDFDFFSNKTSKISLESEEKSKVVQLILERLSLLKSIDAECNPVLKAFAFIKSLDEERAASIVRDKEITIRLELPPKKHDRLEYYLSYLQLIDLRQEIPSGDVESVSYNVLSLTNYLHGIKDIMATFCATNDEIAAGDAFCKAVLKAGKKRLQELIWEIAVNSSDVGDATTTDEMKKGRESLEEDCCDALCVDYLDDSLRVRVVEEVCDIVNTLDFDDLLIQNREALREYRSEDGDSRVETENDENIQLDTIHYMFQRWARK